ncbi:FecCD family ABC transporter permease [Burkholderia thailandensis]|uniref:Iron compound ABC transporter, permease protein n=1 Tax=Burkholderia thailandensis (strain ATCC 700388 / DSM 13276 / CCUG 48851 / CIP 106301 / E264) TaxID=271848 RepID=Q2SYN8_BURTA|nr:iron ABC transporter permease [Burkholderia thailandensis]ABC39487.1 iron compound ABC transporter, permease protein [Burkholderia thailandensis E264]AHI72631.1 fecCD transport family protein [Burkholderia thailandensis 2002721723]AHI79213.1 fecCD transport family protein [Burkholderia thailandensis E444]AIC87162.1 fecCD transport family protein [Burkholderia thailandensis USAMRU Malaysia \
MSGAARADAPPASRGRRWRVRLVLPALAVLVAISIVASTALGATTIAPARVVAIVLSHLADLRVTNAHVAHAHAADTLARSGASFAEDSIVWQIRLPRALLAALVGATLAMVGVALQAATANRLADPHLLGVSSGAMLGAVAATLGLGAAFGPFTLSFAAFAGALAATALVIALAYRRGRLEADRLLLAGVAVSFMMTALANLLLYLGDPRAASSVLFWMLGGVGLARWDLLAAPACCAALAALLLFARRRELNALMSGDVAAVSLGVPVARMRREVFVIASFATGAMVAVSGAIGFVGLVTPHLCRRLVGAEHARLLPVAGLSGAALLVWADVAARTLAAPEDLPIGIVTAGLGGAFFVVLMRRR